MSNYRNMGGSLLPASCAEILQPLEFQSGTFSEEYEDAIEIHNAAIAAFDIVRKAYRAREINDEEFRAGREIFDAATHEFDIAYENESFRQQYMKDTTEEPSDQLELF